MICINTVFLSTPR